MTCSGGRRPDGRFTAAATVLLAALALAAPYSQGKEPAHFKGMPLEQALRLLQEQGLQLVYSTRLVRPDMMVRQEPQGTFPAEILHSLLRPHGLDVRPGPGGSLLVVRAEPSGSLEGTVLVAGTAKPLPGVTVRLSGFPKESITGADGKFLLADVPPGRYVLEAARSGFFPVRVRGVRVERSGSLPLVLQLVSRHLGVDEVTTSARGGDDRRARTDPWDALPFRLGPSVPAPGDGLLDAAGRLTGVVSEDDGGVVLVRGSAASDVQVFLDGLELFDPYHLKDQGRLLSIVDSRSLDAGAFSAGGFAAEYGGRMGGVLELESRQSDSPFQASVRLGSENGMLENGGSAGGLRWYAALRYGDPRLLLDELGADLGYRPRYRDTLAKVGFRLGARTTAVAHVLSTLEDISGDEGESLVLVQRPGNFRGSHDQTSGWVTLRSAWTERLYSRAVASWTELTDRREGSTAGFSEVRERRRSGFAAVRWDWIYHAGRHRWRTGLSLMRSRGRFEYSRAADPDAPSPRPSVSAQGQPAASEQAWYVADRMELGRGISLDAGLRWERVRSGDTTDTALSPRLAARWRPRPNLDVRLAWGLYTQPQRLHELDVADGVTKLAPPERAEHRIFEVRHTLPGGWTARVSLFDKRMWNLRPRFENLFDRYVLFPELSEDRVRVSADRSESKGFEAGFASPAGRAVGGWLLYTRASVRDHVGPSWVPRSSDRRHALRFGAGWRPSSAWRVALEGRLYSGRPATPLTVISGLPEPVLEPGPRNSARLPAYVRLDARVERVWSFRGQDLRLSLDIYNLLDRRNACCIDRARISADGATAAPLYRSGLRRYVRLGLSWRFGRPGPGRAASAALSAGAEAEAGFEPVHPADASP